MKLQHLRSFIVLLAGLITLIINMKAGRDVTWSLVIVLVVILLFYILATLAVEILQNAMEKTEDGNDDVSEEASDTNDRNGELDERLYDVDEENEG